MSDTRSWAKVHRAVDAAINDERAQRVRERAQRVSIQQAVGHLADDIYSEGPRSDGERLARLLAAADDVALAYHGQGVLSNALLEYLAEGQVWLEALEHEAAR